MPNRKGRTLSRLVVPMSIKAVTDANGVHTFEGLAATWQQDLGNDIIKKGAFKKTITDWKAGNDALPLLNSHGASDIFSAIGQLLDAQETKDGLWTKWALLPGAEGDAVHVRLMPHPLTDKPTVGKMSIGYEAVKFSYEQPEGTTSFFDRIRHLEEVNLKEVSLVLFPMNEGATIDSSTVKQFSMMVKSADPATMDGLTRHQLRELNGRIGNLLKKHKENDVSDDERVLPTQQSSTSESSPLSTPTDEEVEELDIASELLDEQETEALKEKRKKKTVPVVEEDPQDDDDDSESSSNDADDSSESHESTSDDSATNDGVKIYPFAEALSQRIRGLRIQRIASGLERSDVE